MVSIHGCRPADIVHLHNLHGGYFNPFSLALIAQTRPVVWTLHDMQALTGHCAHSFACQRWQTGCGRCPYLNVYPALERDTSDRLWADKRMIYAHSPVQLVVPSQWLAAKIPASILAGQDLAVIPNGVDTQVFKRHDKAAVRRRHGLPADAVLVGGAAFGGALTNGWKGGIFALKTLDALAARFPSARMVSIGASATGGPPNVIHIPPVDDEAVLAELLSALDIYLMTSIAENCPLVVLEAMACGVPVVAFATGGVPELVQDGRQGRVVAYLDADALVRAVVDLAADPQRCTAMGAAARRRAEAAYDHRCIARRYEIVYRRWQARWDRARRQRPPISGDGLPPIARTERFSAALARLGQPEPAPLPPAAGVGDLKRQAAAAFDDGDLQRAARRLRQILAITPDDASIHADLGRVLTAAGDPDGAIEAFGRALARRPDDTDLLNDLGLALQSTGQAQAAAILFRQVVCRMPQASRGHYNLANALQECGDDAGALAAYDSALALAPEAADAHFNRSLVLLRQGRYRDGWAEYEWRFGPPTARGGRTAPASWDGAPFAGRTLWVHDEQGIGDTLQFVRFLPRVKALGGNVVFDAIPALARLLAGADGIDRLVDRRGGADPLPEADLAVPLMSLPHRLGIELDDLAGTVPYIQADGELTARWAQRIGSDGLRLGIVWSGQSGAAYARAASAGLDGIGLKWAARPAVTNPARRNLGLADFAGLAKIPGIRLFGLQKGDAADEVHAHPGVLEANLGEALGDFADTAAAIASLDLVISVDTAVAHLAGAMNRPVWVLLPFASDWRWLRDRNDSPWYPSARLFRQPSPGDWPAVFERIYDALQQAVKSTRP